MASLVPSHLILGFDHLHFWVGNALQAATYYVARFGFERVAYQGLETSQRNFSSHVVRQGQTTFVFTSQLTPEPSEVAEFISKHGDGVRDVAFLVSDCQLCFKLIRSRGEVDVIEEPHEYSDDQGTIIVAKFKAFGDVIHSLVERKDYNGPFLPGFRAVEEVDPLSQITPSPALIRIDHMVGNLSVGQLEPTILWYLNVFGFEIIKDATVATSMTSLRTVVVGRAGVVSLPLLEPTPGKKKSQNQEYLDFNGGPGIQHIAMETRDIVHAVRSLQARGVLFQRVPPSYYEEHLKSSLQKPRTFTMKESLEDLMALGIMCDFDSNGYLLQIFTKIVQDRPTIFVELIQRENNPGFGDGNIQALFECVEKEQMARGTL